MAKKNKNWGEIDTWGPERLMARVRTLSHEIEGVYAADIAAHVDNSEKLAEKADEMVYILLMLFKSAKEHKNWTETSPIDLFTGIFFPCSGYVWAAVLSRFCESKSLVERFKSSEKSERDKIKPKLVSRGFIG
jgi:hypothetical protein